MIQYRGKPANYAINVGGSIVPLLVMAVTVPIYVRTIGDARYGALSIVWLLLGYVGFLDLGLTRASENALAKASGNERASILVTAFMLNAGLGLIGALILVVAGGFVFEHVMFVKNALLREIYSAIPWIAALFPLALVSGVAGGALDSREHFLTANLISVTGTIIGQVAPLLCAIFLSPSLAVVVPAAVLSRAANILALVFFVYWNEHTLRIFHFNCTTARKLLGYGSWVTVSGIIGPLLASLDQLVIGSRLSISAVTYYAVPMNMVIKGQVIPGAMARTLFPSLSRIDKADARSLGGRATNVLAFGFAVFCASAIISISAILSIWMGPDFAVRATPVAQVLLIGAWINGVAFIPYVFLQAQGRPDLVAKFHTAEILPFLGLLWFATERFGLVGAATAWTLRSGVDAILMLAAAGFGRTMTLRLLLPASCVLASYAITILIQFTFVAAFLLAFCVAFCIGMLSLAADATLRDILRQMLGRLGIGSNATGSASL